MTPGPILFVCTGNICRSAMAEAMLKDLLTKEGLDGIDVFSRGIGVWDPQPMDEQALSALRAAGLEPAAHESKLLGEDDMDRAGRVLAMTHQHMKVILTNFPEAKPKVRLLAASDIDDPVGGSPKAFEKCRIEIQNALQNLLSELKSERNQP